MAVVQSRIIQKVKALKKRKRELQKQVARATDITYRYAYRRDLIELQWALDDWRKFAKANGVNPKSI